MGVCQKYIISVSYLIFGEYAVKKERHLCTTYAATATSRSVPTSLDVFCLNLHGEKIYFGNICLDHLDRLRTEYFIGASRVRVGVDLCNCHFWFQSRSCLPDIRDMALCTEQGAYKHVVLICARRRKTKKVQSAS